MITDKTYKKPSIVLDIDETLVHSYIYRKETIDFINTLDVFEKKIVLEKNPVTKNVVNHGKKNFTDPLCLTNFILEDYIYIVMMRPFVIYFLMKIDKYFDIHVYSLGSIEYITKILDAFNLLLKKNLFKKVIANQNTGQRFYRKLIANLDIGFSNILIIDDRSDVWNFDTHLLYKIIPYTNTFDVFEYELDNNKIYYNSLTTDTELLKLAKLIDKYFLLYPFNSFNMSKFKNIVLNHDYLESINFEFFLYN